MIAEPIRVHVLSVLLHWPPAESDRGKGGHFFYLARNFETALSFRIFKRGELERIFLLPSSHNSLQKQLSTLKTPSNTESSRRIIRIQRHRRWRFRRHLRQYDYQGW